MLKRLVLDQVVDSDEAKRIDEVVDEQGESEHARRHVEVHAVGQTHLHDVVELL